MKGAVLALLTSGMNSNVYKGGEHGEGSTPCYLDSKGILHLLQQQIKLGTSELEADSLSIKLLAIIFYVIVGH